jgi:hypothetical protein
VEGYQRERKRENAAPQPQGVIEKAWALAPCSSSRSNRPGCSPGRTRSAISQDLCLLGHHFPEGLIYFDSFH